MACLAMLRGVRSPFRKEAIHGSSYSGPPRCQVGAQHRRIRQAPDLPFADLLEPELVQQALQEEKVSFRDRLFSPLVTLWVFLSQVLDPDHSCRQAVSRFVAWRAARGLARCS